MGDLGIFRGTGGVSGDTCNWVGKREYFCSTWKPLSNCDFSSTVVVDVIVVYKDHDDDDGATIGKSRPCLHRPLEEQRKRNQLIRPIFHQTAVITIKCIDLTEKHLMNKILQFWLKGRSFVLKVTRALTLWVRTDKTLLFLYMYSFYSNL